MTDKKRLILLRHAKSSWSSDAPDDHSRPLNKRGKHDAPRVAAHLDERGWFPEHVISSDSERTRQTVARMSEALDFEPRVTWRRDLYHAGLDAIWRAIADHGEGHDALMVVGHNPGWEAAVEELSGRPTRFTTCNAALFEVDADDWASARTSDRWVLVDLIRPRELPK